MPADHRRSHIPLFTTILFLFFVSKVFAAYFPDTGDRAITGDWDFGSGGFEIENNTDVPLTCTDGQLFLDTDATSGQQLMGCENGEFIVQGDSITKNTIADPTGNTTIYFTDYPNTWTSADPGGTFFSITSSDADLAAETSLVDLVFFDDNDPQGVFLRVRDNNSSDLLMEFNSENGTAFVHSIAGMVANARETNSLIQFDSTGLIEIEAGGTEYFAVAAGGTEFVFNEPSTDKDLRFESDNDDAVLFVDGGTNFIGIGLSTPGQELEVDGDIRLDFNNAATTNGVCHSGADSDTTAVTRDLVICNAAPGDIAEWYDTTGVEAGDIVSVTQETMTYSSPKLNALTGEFTGELTTKTVSVLEKSKEAYDRLSVGVISTSPVDIMGAAIKGTAKEPAPLALIGRVPVKVNLENGAIEPGDMITASSTPGVGMKATKAGWVIGMALSSIHENQMGSAEKYTKATVFINPRFWPGEDIEELTDILKEIDNMQETNHLLNEELTEITSQIERLHPALTQTQSQSDDKI